MISCSRSASRRRLLHLRLGGLLALGGRRRLPRLRRDRADGVRDRAGVALASEQRPENGPGARDHRVGLARPLLRVDLLDAALGELERVLEAILLRLQAVLKLRGLGISLLLARLVAALRERVLRLAGREVQLQLLVAEDLERAVRDEARLHVLAAWAKNFASPIGAAGST
jgi:hypothetical protein